MKRRLSYYRRSVGRHVTRCTDRRCCVYCGGMRVVLDQESWRAPGETCAQQWI